MFSHFLLGEYRSFLLGECRSFSKGTVSLLWFQQSWWWVAASLLSKDKAQGTIPLLRLCTERPSRIMNLCRETVRKRQRKIWRKNPNLFPTLLVPLWCSHLSASTLQHLWYFEELLCTWCLFFTAPQGFSAPCPTGAQNCVQKKSLSSEVITGCSSEHFTHFSLFQTLQSLVWNVFSPHPYANSSPPRCQGSPAHSLQSTEVHSAAACMALAGAAGAGMCSQWTRAEPSHDLCAVCNPWPVPPLPFSFLEAFGWNSSAQFWSADKFRFMSVLQNCAGGGRDNTNLQVKLVMQNPFIMNTASQ